MRLVTNINMRKVVVRKYIMPNVCRIIYYIANKIIDNLSQFK